MADAFTSMQGDILQRFTTRKYLDPLSGEEKTDTQFAGYYLHDINGNRTPVSDQQVAEIQAERARTKRMQQGLSVPGIDPNAGMLSSFLNATAQGVSDLTSSPVDVYASLAGSESAQRMAQALSEEKEARFPINPKYEFANAIGSGLGSVTAALPALVFPGMAVPGIALMTGAAFSEGKNRYRSWARENNQAYDRSTELFVGTGYGAAATLSESLGLNLIIKSVKKAPVMSMSSIGKAIFSGDRGMLKAALESAGILPAIYESGQEITEGMLDQLINKVYDEHAGVFDELTQNAAGGLAGGLALGFLGGRVQHARLQHRLKAVGVTNADISQVQYAGMQQFSAEKTLHDEAFKQMHRADMFESMALQPFAARQDVNATVMPNGAMDVEPLSKPAQIEDRRGRLFAGAEARQTEREQSTDAYRKQQREQQVAEMTNKLHLENVERAQIYARLEQDQQAILAEVRAKVEEVAKAKATVDAGVKKAAKSLKQRLTEGSSKSVAKQPEGVPKLQLELAMRTLALKKTLDRVGAVARSAQAFAVLTDEDVAEIWPDDAVRGEAIMRKNLIANDPFYAAITEAEKLNTLVGSAEDKAVLNDALNVDKEELKNAMKDFLAFNKNLDASRDPSTPQGAPIVDTPEEQALAAQDEMIDEAEDVVDVEASAEVDDMLDEGIIARLALGEDTMQDYLDELGLDEYTLEDLQNHGFQIHDISELGDDADYEYQYAILPDAVTANQRTQQEPKQSKYKDNLTAAILSRVEGDPDEKTLSIMFNNLVRTGIARGIIKSPTQLYAWVRDPETGETSQQPINGMIDHQKRIIHISPNVQWNTVGHEAFHGLVRALGMSHPIIKRGLQITNGNIEELADLVGDYYAARYMNKSLWQRLRMFLRTLYVSTIGKIGFMQTDVSIIAAINGKIENFTGYKVNPEMRYPYREFQVTARDGIVPTVRGLANHDPESAKIIAELGELFKNKEVVKDFVGRMMGMSKSKKFKQTVKDAMKLLTNGKEFETFWKRIMNAAMHPNRPSLGFTPTDSQLVAMMEMIHQARNQYDSAIANARGEAEIASIRGQHKMFIAMFNGMISNTGRSLVTVKHIKKRFSEQGVRVSSRFAAEVSKADLADPDEFYRTMNFVSDPTSLDWIRDIYLNGLLSNPGTLFMLNPGTNAMMYASVLSVNPVLRGGVDWLLTKVGAQGSRTRFAGEVIGSQKFLDVKGMKARRKKEFWHIMKTGEAHTDTKLAYEGIWQPHMSAAKRAGMPKTDVAINLPGRFMMAVDASFKISLEDRFRLSHAYRQAKLDSFGDRQKFEALFEKYRTEPTENIKKKAAQDAARAMFAQKPGHVVRAFMRIREEHKLLSMFPMPFLTTIAAISKIGLKLTPGVGMVYNAPGLHRYIEAHRDVIQVVLPDPNKPGDTIIREFKGNLRPGTTDIEKLKAQAAKKFPNAIELIPVAGTHKGIAQEQHAGSVPLTDYVADQLAGTMLTMALWAAFDGKDEEGDPYITGPRSRDPGKRELNEARNIGPWSVNLQAIFPAMENPTWLDYSRLDPIAMPLKILATGMQYVREAKTTEDQDQLLRGMIDDIGIVIRESTPLSGTFSMFGSTFDRIQQTAERLPGNLILPYSGARRALVNAAMGERKARDREIDAAWTNALEDVGNVVLFGLGKEAWYGATEINALGEKVKPQRDLWQFWNPFHVYSEETDDVEQVMTQMEISPRLPRRKITIGKEEYKLNKDTYWQYVAAYGKASKEAARKLIQRPYFNNIQSDDRKALLLNKVMQRAEHQVLKKLKVQLRQEGLASLGLPQ